MATTTRIDLSLPDAMREWVESRVTSGLYETTDAYIQDLILQDRALVNGEKEWLAELDKRMIESDADIAEGRLHDLDEVCDELVRAYRELKKGRDAA